MRRQVILVGTSRRPAAREEPYLDRSSTIRASYRQEMVALVERFWQTGVRRFGVYYQIDAYAAAVPTAVARGSRSAECGSPPRPPCPRRKLRTT